MIEQLHQRILDEVKKSAKRVHDHVLEEILDNIETLCPDPSNPDTLADSIVRQVLGALDEYEGDLSLILHGSPHLDIVIKENQEDWEVDYPEEIPLSAVAKDVLYDSVSRVILAELNNRGVLSEEDLDKFDGLFLG